MDGDIEVEAVSAPFGLPLIVTRAEVFAVKDAQWTLCALMQQTIMAMHGKAERSA